MTISGDLNADIRKGVQITSKLRQGSGTVGTSAVALSSSAIDINWVVVQAARTNSGQIFVGDSTVSNSGSNAGPELSANMPITFVVDDLSKVFVIGSAAGQTYRYLAGSA